MAHIDLPDEHEHEPVDDIEKSIVANAIGYEFFAFDRDTHEVEGVTQVEVSDEELERCTRAAERALRHLDAYRRGAQAS